MVQSSVPWLALGGLICIELWWNRLHCDGSIKRPMVCSGWPDLHLSFGGRGCTVMVQSSVPWLALGGLICI